MADELTPSLLESLIRERPADVDAALQQVSPIGVRLGMVEMAPFLGVSAEQDGATFAARTLAYLRAVNLFDEFSAVLTGADARADLAAEIADMQIDPAIGERLFRRTIHARCAILRGGQFQGSGCLVGPSLVLTCAHVLGKRDPGDGFPKVEVVLGNSNRIGVVARPVRFSPVALADEKQPFARTDDPYDSHDYALLRLRVPVGANAVVVECPGKDWKPTRRAPLFLLHFPQGQDQGIGLGQLASFSRPSLRWGYLAKGAKPGSSGGACFNARGELIGIHQGRLCNGSRLVPFKLFRGAIAEDIANDLWPKYLWSPEGRLEGTLVIGRGDLFRAFALLARPDNSYRSLRIKRLDPASGGEGLGFSVRLVRQLIDRQPKGQRAITLSWPQALYNDYDIIAEFLKHVRAEQLLDAAEEGEAPLAVSAKPDAAKALGDRLASVLRAIQGKLATRGETLWIIVEHANVSPGSQLVGLELLASLAPRWPSLRLVLVGHEALSLPEPEFRVDDVAQSDLPGVTLVEYLGPIARRDVEEFIVGMHQAIFGEPPLPAQLQAWTRSALADAPQVTNGYPPAALPGITTRLRDIFRDLLPPDLKVPGS